MSIDTSRRHFLQQAGMGIGWLAALDLFQRGAVAATGGTSPLAPKPPHFPATATRVISIFMQGGPSQVDTYDPKPLLAKLHGQHPPESFGNEDFQNGKFRDTVILGSKRTFKQYGRSGLCVSDLFPHTSQCVDRRTAASIAPSWRWGGVYLSVKAVFSLRKHQISHHL